MRIRRAFPILVSAVMLFSLLPQPARAASQQLTGVSILLNTDEIGIETDVQLAAYTAPESAADRRVTWKAMPAAEGLCAIALTKVGCPYLLGAGGPNVFDCSGFISWCLKTAGVPFVRMNSFDWRTNTQFQRVESMHDIRTGDVLVFYGDTETSSGHVGIYLGGGSMVDASDSQGKVRVTNDVSADGGYWSRVFCAAYRIFTENGTATVSADGVLRAQTPGRIAVSATAHDGGGATDIRFLDVLPFCGLGTEHAPFLISAPDTLTDITKYPGYFYRLTGDVDLSALCAREEGFLPIGTESSPFSGVFDGGGFCVSGLSQRFEANGSGGLFGVVSGTVKNLSVRADITVEGENGIAGAVAAKVSGGMLLSCAAAGSVRAGTAGGMAGVISGKGRVLDCASTADTSGAVAGGVAGTVEARADILRCCAYGYARGDVAGAVAGVLKGECADSYYLARRANAFGSGSGNGSAAALSVEMLSYASSYPALFDGDAWKTQQTACVFALPAAVSAKHFFPENTTLFAGGRGIPYAPYRIETAEQLTHMAAFPGAWYLLCADITPDAPLSPIGTPDMPFCGVLSGGGHTLRGYAITGTDAAGLFGYTDGAELSQLSVRGADVSGGCAGLLAGTAKDTVIRGCSATGTVHGATAGGLVGCMSGGLMEACYSGVSVSASGTAGGVVGEAAAKIAECCASGDVSGAVAGGIAGSCADVIRDCFYTGMAEAAVSGGIAGTLEGTVSRCYTIYGATVGSAGADSAQTDCVPDVSALAEPHDAFSRFDFNTVWTMDGSAVYAYPELQRTAYLPGLITDIRVTGPAEVPLGFPSQFLAESDADAASDALTWSVDAITGAAEITRDGVLTGSAAGTVTVSCRSQDGGGAAGSVTVRIADAGVERMELAVTSEMLVGQSAAYSAKTLPYALDASAITIQSSAPEIVSVDPATCKLTANAVGDAVITATAQGVSASQTVLVRASAAALLLSQKTLTIPVGLTLPLTYRLVPETAKGSVVYSCSDPAVAAVDRNGFVTGLTLGTAEIICMDVSGVSDTCSVTVVRGTLSVPGPVGLHVKDKVRLSPVLQMGEGMRKPVLRYRSSDPAIATVSWRGVVRGKNAGTCVITVYDRRDPAFCTAVTVNVSP